MQQQVLKIECNNLSHVLKWHLPGHRRCDLLQHTQHNVHVVLAVSLDVCVQVMVHIVSWGLAARSMTFDVAMEASQSLGQDQHYCHMLIAVTLVWTPCW